MLKVCGVTFDHMTNYGSCLQAYALQTAIESIYFDAERCRYTSLPSFDTADEKMALMREKSMAFLRDNLEAALSQKTN